MLVSVAKALEIEDRVLRTAAIFNASTREAKVSNTPPRQIRTTAHDPRPGEWGPLATKENKQNLMHFFGFPGPWKIGLKWHELGLGGSFSD